MVAFTACDIPVMRFLHLKADSLLGRFGQGGWIDDGHDALEDGDDSRFMYIEPVFEFFLQRREFAGQVAVIGQSGAHLYECPHNKHTHLGRTGAVENIGRHDCAVLGKGVGEILDVLAALQGSKLEP